MTRFLKLIRAENGSWQALPPAETDHLAPVNKLQKDAPIDPAQLLKALAPLLSTDGGINGLEKATQFASLMKKFSKKLVSRCVYCNVLRATKEDILSRFLSESGWDTINVWLNDAKENDNVHFIIELLRLCIVLPMTVERLKENNTPKIIKTLTKYENKVVKSLSEELVTKWMVLIKGDHPPPVELLKKKRKLSKEIERIDKELKDPKKVVRKEKVSPVREEETEKKPPLKRIPKIKGKPLKELPQKSEETVVPKNEKVAAQKTLKGAPKNVPPKSAKTASPKNVRELSRQPVRLRGTKRTSSDKDLPKNEIYEDVKIKIEPVPKKPKVDRPKTVKVAQTKFRATGLEEAVPLPKKIPKKPAVVDKVAASAALAKSAANKKLTITLPEKVTEKKIKPESLLQVNEVANQNGGIKLIPAKPRPAHILHESASFMDALIAQPAPAPKRKKKQPANKPSTPTTPTSPTAIKPPKLQFYKDTLEMKSEESSKEDSKDNSEVKNSPTSPPKDEESKEIDEKATKGEEPGKDEPVKSENTDTPESPPSSEMADPDVKLKEKVENDEKEEEASEKDSEDRSASSGGLRSILALGRRRGRKKSVRWVEDDNLKQFFYFELDETERENVMRLHRPFGDMKSLEAKREREFIEAHKRHAGDKMEEAIPWWTVPILIDVPPPLGEYGVYSQEKEIQHLRQQSILQEIYFTREMVPDTPQEPELEIVPVQEPKIIPLDEENVVGSVMDYSGQDIPKPKPALPEVLSTLIKIPNMRPQPPQQQQQKQLLPPPVIQVQVLVCPAG